MKSYCEYIFTNRIIWIILNNIFYLSIWPIIYVCSSIVSWKACKYRGANRSELKRKQKKNCQFSFDQQRTRSVPAQNPAICYTKEKKKLTAAHSHRPEAFQKNTCKPYMRIPIKSEISNIIALAFGREIEGPDYSVWSTFGSIYDH